MTSITTTALLVAIISTTWAQCPPGGPAIQTSSVFSMARNVLLGRDITPTRPCSFGDLKLCRRRQIQFEVYCTLKKTDNFSPQPIYFIGENRTVDLCDATFMEYNNRNDILIVLVTYKKMNDGQGLIDWDEVVPGRRAIYSYNDVTMGTTLNATCDLGEFTKGSNDGAFCPTQAPMAMCHNRFKNILTVVFQNSEETMLGTQCCRELVTSPADISVNDTSVDAVVPSYATSKMPSIYIGALRPDFTMSTGALVTVAMVTVKNNATMVYWLVSNVKFQNDGKLKLNEGMTVVRYSEIIPEEKNVQGQIHIFRQLGLVEDEIFLLCRPPCKMDFEQWRRDKSLSLSSTAKMKIVMDDYAVWNLIQNKQLPSNKVCREFDPSLEAFEETVLCPKATTGGATSHKLFPVSIWCLFLVMMHQVINV